MDNSDQAKAVYKTTRILVLSMLVATPLIFLLAIYLIFRHTDRPVHPQDLLFYVLLAVTALVGVIIPIVEKATIKTIAVTPTSTAAESARRIIVCRLALLGSCYMFGVVLFFLTGTANRIPYFYAFGILYSIIYWPTEARFKRIVEQLESK